MSSIVVAGDTSGTITIAAPAVAGSGTLTLPVATDTLVGKATTDTLTNKSIAATQLTGTIAASALPAGSVLQVVQGILTTPVSTSSGTYADTGLTASITPRSTSSKVLVLVNGFGYASTFDTFAQITLVRGATAIICFNNILGYVTASVGGSGSMSTAYLDSPSSTSSTTYKVQWRKASGGGTLTLNNDSGTAPTSSTSTIVLMEIAG